jgi:nucleoside-diphosphate-sugar epimerase
MKTRTSQNASTQKILVTGGGGFLGRVICRKLIERGDRVYSFCRRFYPELEALGVRQIQGDLRDKVAVQSAVADMQMVCHTAAKAGVWGAYRDYEAIKVDGTRNVIAACFHHRVSALIHTSSPSVVFDGTDMEGVDESTPCPARFHAPYPQTKAIAEQLVMEAAQKGLPAIILRPHLIWGPHDPHLVPRILERAPKLVKVGRGNKRVDTIYVDNAADAHILAADALLQHPSLSGRRYFISQDEPIGLWNMIDAILKAGGRPPVRRSVPYPLVWLAGAGLELICKLLHRSDEPPMTRFVAEELATAHWFDISAAKRDLGYQPRISTEEGLQHLQAWLNGNPSIR